MSFFGWGAFHVVIPEGGQGKDVQLQFSAYNAIGSHNTIYFSFDTTGGYDLSEPDQAIYIIDLPEDEHFTDTIDIHIPDDASFLILSMQFNTFAAIRITAGSWIGDFGAAVKPALRMNQRNDGAGSIKHARVNVASNVGNQSTSEQTRRSPRVVERQTYL